jgi:N-acetylglucosaminyldiphosphoundecaprenol N-acetyl-beta-D-mannosaminyltransferase
MSQSVRREAASGGARERLRVGKIEIDPVTFAEAIETIAAMVAAGRGASVLTPNLDHVVMAESDDRFRQAYQEATLCVVDGTPLLWASHLLGAPLPERVSGSDLVLPLLERADREGWRVYFLGGGPGVGHRAAQKAVERFPRLAIAGVDAPHIDMAAPPASRNDVLERVRDARPDLVFVGLGAPKQELWIAEARPKLAGPVLIGVGASIDFLAGTVRRAPAWMSSAGLEWLFRLAQEPRRLWKRYLLRDPQFLVILLRELQARRRL